MRGAVAALLLVIVASGAFFVGRGTAPAVVAATSTAIDGRPAVAAAAAGAAGVTGAAAAPTSTGTAADRDRGDGPATDAPPGSPPSTTAPTTGATVAVARAPAATCEARLEETQAELTALVKRREELEGKPIPARDDVAPRFASAGLLSTFQRGFAQSGVKGQVESVDCSEHPCIIFGRLEGDEGEVAKLEDSAVFAAYDDDIGVMLTWASGHGGHDDNGPHTDKPGAGREKPDEVSLFAFAFYGVDEEGRSEQIDRRIRTRTAEYWNASRPRE